MNKLLELGLFETQAVNKKNTEASSAGKILRGSFILEIDSIISW